MASIKYAYPKSIGIDHCTRNSVWTNQFIAYVDTEHDIELVVLFNAGNFPKETFSSQITNAMEIMF